MPIARFIKWVGDRVLSLLLLVALSPMILMIAIAIAIQMGSPVVFTQPRPGYKARIFKFYKFRTMTNACDAQGELLPDEKRITPFGQWLRKTSLDELLQLWNVLNGDMSFVGPRPLLTRYLDRYTPEQARRHDAMPGITGWAQVQGRNSISWEEKFKYDVWYVQNWSLALDCKIIALTFLKVLRQDGISAPDHASMPEFWGTVSDSNSFIDK